MRNEALDEASQIVSYLPDDHANKAGTPERSM